MEAAAKRKNMVKVSVKEMLESGVHFGHQTHRWNPKMRSFIFGKKSQVHIIDLGKTAEKLEEALDFVKELASKNGKILFIGTKKQAQNIVIKEAEKCGMPYIANRWSGGILTNFKTIKLRIKRLKDLEELKSSPEFEKYTKKERILLELELEKLKFLFRGIKDLTELPDAIFVIDVNKEKIAVREAVALGIPIVAMVDTNSSPVGINYFIPSNDDATRSIRLITSAIAQSIIDGKPTKTEKEKEEVLETEEGIKVVPEIETIEEKLEEKISEEETESKLRKQKLKK